MAIILIYGGIVLKSLQSTTTADIVHALQGTLTMIGRVQHHVSTDSSCMQDITNHLRAGQDRLLDVANITTMAVPTTPSVSKMQTS